MRQKMKVRCIKRKAKNNYWNYVAITIGKIYEVLKENNDGYLIEDDNGNAFMYYEKYLFEIVEEEKMKVVKIKSWEDLDGVKNDNYFLTVGGNGFISAYDLTKTKYYGEFKPKLDANLTIAWLKLFGFNIEFIESPLEQVKEYITHKKSNIKAITIRDDYNNGYADGEMSALNALLLKIERIEKDEH